MTINAIDVDKIDLNGHHVFFYDPKGTIAVFSCLMEDTSVPPVVQPLGALFCDFCEHLLGFDEDAQQSEGRYVWEGAPCSAEHFEAYEYEFEIPSGKIVFRDDLRGIVPGLVDSSVDNDGVFINYNTVIGRGKTMANYLDQGVAYGPVGNSSPSIVLDTLENRILVGQWNDEEAHHTRPSWYKEIGVVCTDLHAYSIMDYDAYVKAGGDLSRVQVGEVPAGVYHVKHSIYAGFQSCYEENQFEQYSTMALIN